METDEKLDFFDPIFNLLDTYSTVLISSYFFIFNWFESLHDSNTKTK